jgi:hypothetical protein
VRFARPEAVGLAGRDPVVRDGWPIICRNARTCGEVCQCTGFTIILGTVNGFPHLVEMEKKPAQAGPSGGVEDETFTFLIETLREKYTALRLHGKQSHYRAMGCHERAISPLCLSMGMSIFTRMRAYATAADTRSTDFAAASKIRTTNSPHCSNLGGFRKTNLPL